MSALKLIARATKTEVGWRPEVLILDEGTQDLWGTASVATHAEAKRLAHRLVTIAAEMCRARAGWVPPPTQPSCEKEKETEL